MGSIEGIRAVKVLLDTNLLIDVALERQPYFEQVNMFYYSSSRDKLKAISQHLPLVTFTISSVKTRSESIV